MEMTNGTGRIRIYRARTQTELTHRSGRRLVNFPVVDLVECHRGSRAGDQGRATGGGAADEQTRPEALLEAPLEAPSDDPPWGADGPAADGAHQAENYGSLESHVALMFYFDHHNGVFASTS